MPKCLLISSVVPSASAGGGELVLKRHLSLLKDSNHDWTVDIATTERDQESSPDFNWNEVPQFRIPQRILSTRLAPYLNDQIYLGKTISINHVRNLAKRTQPDVILTVAHGGLFPVARRLSEELSIPMVSIFHDWWPDMPSFTSRGKSRISKEFFALSRSSVSSLAVCDGMSEKLRHPKNCEVLHPIPGDASPVQFNSQETDVGSRPLKIVYAGNLSGTYGQMIRSLSESLTDSKTLSLRCCGPPSGQAFPDEAECYDGLIAPKELGNYLTSADILLVTMSFKPEEKRRAETSFPSKLVEYCQTNMPILVWGPDYCSAAKWANAQNPTALVTENDPIAVVKALNLLKDSPNFLSKLRQTAREASNGCFSQEGIQTQFETALLRACASGAHT